MLDASARLAGLSEDVRNAESAESQSFDEKSGSTAMKKKILVLMGLACAVAAVFAVGVRGDAADEVKRLAEVMGGEAGAGAADIGAGGGEVTVGGGGSGGGRGGDRWRGEM